MFENMEKELKLRGYSDKTIKNYKFYNKKFIEYIKKSPRDTNKDDIKEYLNYLIDNKAKPRTINMAYSALKFYYSVFMNKQLFKRIKRCKIEKDIPFVLSRDEIIAMINCTKNIKHKLLIELLYSSGTRIEETVKIKVQYIDFEQKLIFIKAGKGKKDRYIITSERFINDLNYYLRRREFKSQYVFDTINSHMTVRAAQAVTKKAAKRAGIVKRVYPHLLRASFATHLLEDKTPLNKIQKLMGHTRINTTMDYIKTKTDDIKSVTSPLDKLAQTQAV
jgi:site-specific recombinase XerD